MKAFEPQRFSMGENKPDDAGKKGSMQNRFALREKVENLAKLRDLNSYLTDRVKAFLATTLVAFAGNVYANTDNSVNTDYTETPHRVTNGVGFEDYGSGGISSSYSDALGEYAEAAGQMGEGDYEYFLPKSLSQEFTSPERKDISHLAVPKGGQWGDKLDGSDKVRDQKINLSNGPGTYLNSIKKVDIDLDEMAKEALKSLREVTPNFDFGGLNDKVDKSVSNVLNLKLPKDFFKSAGPDSGLVTGKGNIDIKKNDKGINSSPYEFGEEASRKFENMMRDFKGVFDMRTQYVLDKESTVKRVGTGAYTRDWRSGNIYEINLVEKREKDRFRPAKHGDLVSGPTDRQIQGVFALASHYAKPLVGKISEIMNCSPDDIRVGLAPATSIHLGSDGRTMKEDMNQVHAQIDMRFCRTVTHVDKDGRKTQREWVIKIVNNSYGLGGGADLRKKEGTFEKSIELGSLHKRVYSKGTSLYEVKHNRVIITAGVEQKIPIKIGNLLPQSASLYATVGAVYGYDNKGKGKLLPAFTIGYEDKYARFGLMPMRTRDELTGKNTTGLVVYFDKPINLTF